MKKDTIEMVFGNLEGDLDIEMPTFGHEQRFLNKLTAEKNIANKTKKKLSFYKPLLALAASIVLCFGLFVLLKNRPEVQGLASVSPELSQTQDFFTATITSELNKIKDRRSSDNETLVSDALKQMELLEKNHERLKIDLKESGHDKRVIYAIINNFQSRIDLLENLITAIENLKINQSQQNQMTL